MGQRDVVSFYQLLVRCFLIAAMAILPVFTGAAVAAELGDTITNIARLAWTNGGSRINVVTNEASNRIEAPRTESTIEFFRHAPSLQGADRKSVV